MQMVFVPQSNPNSNAVPNLFPFSSFITRSMSHLCLFFSYGVLSYLFTSLVLVWSCSFVWPWTLTLNSTLTLILSLTLWPWPLPSPLNLNPKRWSWTLILNLDPNTQPWPWTSTLNLDPKLTLCLVLVVGDFIANLISTGTHLYVPTKNGKGNTNPKDLLVVRMGYDVLVGLRRLGRCNFDDLTELVNELSRKHFLPSLNATSVRIYFERIL